MPKLQSRPRSSRTGLAQESDTAEKSKTESSPTNLVSVSRPQAPALYGFKKSEKYLPWSHAEERLARARNYWICTSRPDGRAHSIPVWGMWVEDAFYFGTARSSRKARNLVHNPAISVHLESGDDVVIIEGSAEEARGIIEKKERDQDLFAKLDAASRNKYKMPLMVVPDSVIYRVQPRIVLAWTEKDFPNNATRWEFKVDK
jgi:nitroimidazol reductase NimA-like FMN-containing flavoprotein (pyridoxamine 5'-phosphate oxidase superfamily)